MTFLQQSSISTLGILEVTAVENVILSDWQSRTLQPMIRKGCRMNLTITKHLQKQSMTSFVLIVLTKHNYCFICYLILFYLLPITVHVCTVCPHGNLILNREIIDKKEIKCMAVTDNCRLVVLLKYSVELHYTNFVGSNSLAGLIELVVVWSRAN